MKEHTKWEQRKKQGQSSAKKNTTINAVETIARNGFSPSKSSVHCILVKKKI
jgi:hypothetical protein